MDISKHLIQLREEAGLSKNKLAQKAGISQAYISQLEAGYKQPTIDIISRICSALGITLAEFFAEEKSDIPPDLMQLLREAENLTPEQREQLTNFLKTLKGN